MADEERAQEGELIAKKLPPWLNPFQLVAWVRYRDISITEEADTHTNLAAKVYFPTAEQVGSVDQALDALQSGRLRSYGAERGGKMTEIEAVEWTRIALAPLDPSRQHPYDSIRFCCADVVAVFPPMDSEGAANSDPSGSLSAAANTIGLRSRANLQPVASLDHGGAGQLRRLDGIAVPNAIRLNDAVADLAIGISSGPDLSDTETAIEFKFYSSDSDQLREWQVREVSMFYVREAIQSGKLTLYTMLVSGAHPIDRHALKELTFGTLRSGTYRPTNRLGDPLADTALWILRTDWEDFRQKTLSARSGDPSPPLTGTASWAPNAIRWSDLAPPELEQAKRLAREAEADEWWNWPEAVAWVGARSLEHIATMRLCAEPWMERADYDPAVALGAEHYLASAYCDDPAEAERNLKRAIERGAIRTLGRAAVDKPAHDLTPRDWRGGKVVYNRTATLVSAANVLSEWACDIEVSRPDLWAAFPADREAEKSALPSKGGRPPEHDWDAMKRLAEAAIEDHPNLSRSKLADSLVSEYQAKVSPSPPVKRTIERKLGEWGIGATKPFRP